MLKKPAIYFLTFVILLLSTTKPTLAKDYALTNIWRFPIALFNLRYLILTNLSPKVLGESSSEVSLSPTATLTPSKTPTPTLTSTLPPQKTFGASDDVVRNYMMDEINSFRRSYGLSEVQNDSYSCEFAKLRAQEVSINFNHSGFRNRLNQGSLPYPSYTAVTENIAENYDYKNVVASWIDSFGHAENMKADTPFVCVERHGTYYAYEGWKPRQD